MLILSESKNNLFIHSLHYITLHVAPSKIVVVKKRIYVCVSRNVGIEMQQVSIQLYQFFRVSLQSRSVFV